MRKLLKAIALGSALALAWPASQAATPDDTLVLAWRFDDIISLDPGEMFEISTYEMVGNVYETLVSIDPRDTSHVINLAAKSWSVSDDGLTFTFELRPGMKFHSGNPVTAADVVYSFSRLTAMDMGPAFLIQDIGVTADNMGKTLKAAGPLTFKMKVDKPYSPSYVINVLSASNFVIVDSKLLKQHAKDGDWGNAWLKTRSAGSGPFELGRWKPDELLTMVRNPNYYGHKAGLEQIVWRHIAEQSTQRLLLESGDIDIARNLTADLLDGLRAKGGFEITATPQSTSMYMGLNVKNKYLSNPKVREALRYLVDYQGMVDTILRESYVVNQTFLPDSFLGYVDSNPYKLDVAKAKSLLASAGYADGFPLTANVSSTHQDRMDIAQSVQATFGQAGIKLKILSSDSKTALTTYRARNHDIYIGTWGVDYFDPNTNMVFVANYDNSDSPKGKPLAWRNAWQDKDLTATAASLVLETDAAKRKSGYQKLIRKWQPRSAFAMLFQQTLVAAYSPRVKNFFIGPSAETTLYSGVTKN